MSLCSDKRFFFIFWSPPFVTLHGDQVSSSQVPRLFFFSTPYMQIPQQYYINFHRFFKLSFSFIIPKHPIIQRYSLVSQVVDTPSFKKQIFDALNYFNNTHEVNRRIKIYCDLVTPCVLVYATATAAVLPTMETTH